jgi:hypothetical protein
MADPVHPAVEALKRKLCDANWSTQPVSHCTWPQCECMTDVREAVIAYRHVLASLMEPTEAMVEARERARPSNFSDYAWCKAELSAMIEAHARELGIEL